MALIVTNDDSKCQSTVLVGNKIRSELDITTSVHMSCAMIRIKGCCIKDLVRKQKCVLRIRKA